MTSSQSSTMRLTTKIKHSWLSQAAKPSETLNIKLYITLMKTKFLLAICAVALGLSAQAKDYKYQTVDGDMMKTRIYTLDNGLKVYLSVNAEKPRIQTYIAVRTGSKNDPAETTGLAHYLEHLMFKGTKQFGTNNPAA